MWTLIFLFGIATVSLGWICFGYYIFIWIIGLFSKSDKKPRNDNEVFFLSVIVPCFNEVDAICSKINNLKRLDYPVEKLEIIIVDGGSTDGTIDAVRNNINDVANISLLISPQKGKINQLNHALSKAKGEIIVNTDVDGMLEKNCLLKMVEEFKAHRDAAVVSAYSYPKDVSDVDRYYWLSQNRGRILETKAYASSIAIAVCYGFKKDLLKSFPEDVVADDIYIAYLANTLGYKTIYSTKAIAFENRGAKSTIDFIYHKFRKSNAFLKETLRFLYMVPNMPRLWQLMYITKLAQLLLIPWAILSWIILAVSLMTLFRFDIVVLGLVFLLVLVFTTSGIFRQVRIDGKGERYSIYTIIKAFVLSNFILIATGLSYPFYRQDSSYKKIGGI